MKIVKRLAITMTILFGFFALLLFISSIHHQRQLSKEAELLEPPGQMVEVDGHQMHVYEEGEGEETLVFMAGGGTSSPYLDFKSLYSLLSDKYRIVVVEKLGYGFSEITESIRDFDTILAQTRKALLEAEIEGPYVLLPHSMSGLKALYWAQLYPEEIKAVVGLDMAVPATYEDYKVNIPLIHVGAFAADAGITRWGPLVSESDAEKYGNLSDEEKALYRRISHRRTSTPNMVNEVSEIKKNTEKLAREEIPEAPMLLFASNGEGTGFDKENWLELQRNFGWLQGNTRLIELDGSHYIHNIFYEEIAKETDEFIESL